MNRNDGDGTSRLANTGTRLGVKFLSTVLLGDITVVIMKEFVFLNVSWVLLETFHKDS